MRGLMVGSLCMVTACRMCLHVSAIFAQNPTVLLFYACVSKSEHKRRRYKSERQKNVSLGMKYKAGTSALHYR